MDKEKHAALDKYMSRINKKMGRDIVKPGNKESKELLSSGFPYVDVKIGGIPRGTITMLYGRSGAGKTTFAWHFAAHQQSRGLVVAYINAEHSFINDTWAAEIGVKTDELILVNPVTAEEGLVRVEELTKLKDKNGKNVVDIIIYDSIIALATDAQVNQEKDVLAIPKKGKKEGDKKGNFKDLDNQEPALLARKLTEWFARALGLIGINKVAVVFINQVRMNLGGFRAYETYSGGNALQHDLSLALKLSKDKDNETTFLIDKTKINSNEKDIFKLLYLPGKGFDTFSGEITELSEDPRIFEHINKKKTKYYAFVYDGVDFLVAYKTKVAAFFRAQLTGENPLSFEEISKKINEPSEELKLELYKK